MTTLTRILNQIAFVASEGLDKTKFDEEKVKIGKTAWKEVYADNGVKYFESADCKWVIKSDGTYRTLYKTKQLDQLSFNMEPEYEENTAPVDNTRITQIILYLDEPDVAEFKILAKKAMKAIWPDEYLDKSNLSDLFFHLLKTHYGSKAIATEGAPIG